MLINQKNIAYFFVTYLSLFSYFSYSHCPSAFDNDSKSQLTAPKGVLNQQIIDYLDFTPFLYQKRINKEIVSALIKADIVYIGELFQYSRHELLEKLTRPEDDVRHSFFQPFGAVERLRIIQKALDQKKLNLSMQLPQGWTRPQKIDRIETIPREVLNKRILDYLDFSSISAKLLGHIRRAMEALDITYIRDLIQKNKYDFLEISHVGVQTVEAFEQALEKRGLHLNTTLE